MPPRQKKTYSTPIFKKGNAEWLVIVESPSKCVKIEDYLGTAYKCIASNGHFRTIDGMKSIDRKHGYIPKFSLIPDKKDHVDRMRGIISQFQCDRVILATDDDREGEAIAWHICDTFGLSLENTVRVVFHEITATAVRASLINPGRVNLDLVHAQFARQILDIIVGFRISPFLWKYLYHSKENGLSAGRCQTPALRLIYEMSKTVDAPSDDRIYKVVGKFTSKNIEFVLSKEWRDSENSISGFLEKSRIFNHRLSIGESQQSIRSPPKPMNTSGLLQLVSNTLRLSPKDIMALCQVLYQDGHITYMRTENTRYSRDFVNISRDYISKTYGDKFVGDSEHIVSKDDNNPHEAIRVTHIETRELSKKYEGKIASLYKLLWRNTMESCMSPAIYNVTECRISAPDDMWYSNRIERPVFLGWRVVSGEERCQENNLFYLQSLDPSNPVPYHTIETRLIVKERSRHYTESGLIRKLEELGIGRPSTFATILETIQERGYVKLTDIEGTNLSYNEYKLQNDHVETIASTKVIGRETNKLVIQPLGIVIAEFLTSHFVYLFSYEYTSNMERSLDNTTVSNWHVICAECDKTIDQLSKSLEKLGKESYTLDDTHDVVFTKNGPAIKHTSEDGTVRFKSIREDVKIDISQLRDGKYTLDDILQEKQKEIGEIDGNAVYVKHGKYGLYAEWGENKQSLKQLNKPMHEITIDDIRQTSDMKTSNTNILRVLNGTFSIRKGKYGPYIFYQRPDMHKPLFLSLKGFKESWTFCEIDTLIQWIGNTHKIYE